MRLKNAPKLPDPLVFSTFNLLCKLWVVINFEWVISLWIFRIILSHIHLSSEKVSSKSEIGHVPTFENLVHLTWNDPQIRCASLYLSSREKVPFYISTGCCLQFVKQRQCIYEFRKLLFSAVIYFLTSWACTFYLIYTIFKWLQKLHKCWFSYQASVVDSTINLWHPNLAPKSFSTSNLFLFIYYMHMSHPFQL